MSDIINSFPGYKFVDGKNLYRGTDIGKGGYIISNPGIYTNVALLDVASLHPNSIRAMNCFGKYTKNFTDILDARIAIKHKDFDAAREMLDGRLAPYLEDESMAKDLAQALKIAVNSVYGLTAASFENPFKDPRNKNNIVALRGALFMRTLKDEVESRGFKIVAIKTDSIKIAEATKEIIDFCMDFARSYGYTFEHEATYDRMCQINDADYIARYKDSRWCEHTYGYIPGDNAKHAGEWTATGAQFAVPYVFKKLFSHEEIAFEDLCETKEVKTALYLESSDGLPDVTEYESELAALLEDIWRVERGEYPAHVQKARDRVTTLVDRLSEPSLVGKRRIRAEEELDIHHKTIDEYQRNGYDFVSAKKRVEELDQAIAKGHSYRFIGKISSFCPIKPGCGGGTLLRQGTDKYGRTTYSAATGTKDFFWLEAETVKLMGKEQDIDRTYYDKLVDAAVASISSYGDFEWFVADDILPPDGIEELPWLPSCGNAEIGSCWRCPHLHNDQFHLDCRLGHDISDIIVQKRNLIEKEK